MSLIFRFETKVYPPKIYKQSESNKLFKSNVQQKHKDFDKFSPIYSRNYKNYR